MALSVGLSTGEMYLRLMVFVKAVRNQMMPLCTEWRGETDNRATTPVGYCPSTASFSVRPHCKNARWDRCQKDFNKLCFVCQYQSSDWLWRPHSKLPVPYCVGWGDNVYSSL